MDSSVFVFVGILVCILLKSSDSTPAPRCINVDRKSAVEAGNHISEIDVLPRCVTSIENLLNGRIRSGLGHVLEANPPPWFNATLATLGQRLAKKYWFSTNMAQMLDGVTVLTTNDTALTVYYSGAKHLMNALQSATAFHLQDFAWYDENLFSSRPNLLNSLNKVRTIHGTVLNNFKRNITMDSDNHYKIDHEVWKAWKIDLKMSGLLNRSVPPLGRGTPEFRINQYAMTTVLWGLESLLLIRSELLGIPLNGGTDEELEGLLHFWAFVGHSLGLEDKQRNWAISGTKNKQANLH